MKQIDIKVMLHDNGQYAIGFKADLNNHEVNALVSALLSCIDMVKSAEKQRSNSVVVKK